MKKIIAAICILITLSFCCAASAQIDMKHGANDYTEFRLGLYGKGQDGNQDWVREFDGRTFDLGVELLNTYGYKDSLSYWLEARDVIIQDESIDFQLGLKNAFGFHLNTDSLRHRFGRLPAVDPFLVGTPAAGGDTMIDLTPGTHPSIDRKVNDFGFSLSPWRDQKIRLVADWWNENETGSQQVLFRSRAILASEPPLPVGVVSGTRFLSTLLIDRTTEERELGGDFAIGRNSALSYRYRNTDFADAAGQPPAGTVNFPALSRVIQPNTSTIVNTFKGRSRLTDKLYFTGVHVSRNRDNDTSRLSATGDPVAQANRVEIGATNLALSYLATNALNLTARYRKYRLDNLVPPVPDALGVPQNQAVSRDESSLLFDANYTGIRRLFLKGSFERLNVDREASPLHEGHEEFEHPFTSQSTDSNIYRLGARYYPTAKLSMSGNWERHAISDPGFSGTPTDKDNLNFDATYMVGDNFAVYGNFFRWNEHNDQIRVPLADIPTPAVTPEDEDLRSAAAGQGYRNHFQTATLGTWFALTSKLTADLSFGHTKTNAGALWIIGTDPAFLPHLFPDFAPYTSNDNIWQLGMNYAFRPRWRVYSRFLNSHSAGRTLISAVTSGGVDLGIGPVWMPVSYRENRYTLGFGYDLTAREDLLLEFSRSNWDDRIDASQNGSFNLMRIAYEHRY